MLCQKDVSRLGLWTGYIMRVENSANSIVKISDNIGKAFNTAKRKSASKKVVRDIEIELVRN